ncbi:hypothetical protein [Citreimonas salinaria]|uniref:Glycosyl transferase family 8 n=1 Tax=Citreimonas salinaria TaxID=321339 RepID=A0A1H3K0Q3_9RHOB|nr:hypothetical protein [Citreimonas salinaria]SDY45094.1 hypothetical protein SAMN05444340_10868 [Citreimonas salinaria]
MPAPTVLIVAQAGRLQAEALLFAASLAETSPSARLVVAEPQPGPLWDDDPRLDHDARAALRRLGATILPFDARHFGRTYPQGNKIEALFALPADTPFVFFDTDTLILGDLAAVPLDFDRPAASLRREDTWPKPDIAGHDRAAIWRALYDRFDLDIDGSLDTAHAPDDWRRYLYFNAGFFHFRCPHVFGQRFLHIAQTIRDAPPPELAGQSLDPWLDQVALPLVIHGLGGGRDALEPGWLDGRTSCHWRALPLLYARESDAVVDTVERIANRPDLKPLLARHAPLRKLVHEGGGARIRAMFDRTALPAQERDLRKRIRAAGLWLR